MLIGANEEIKKEVKENIQTSRSEPQILISLVPPIMPALIVEK